MFDKFFVELVAAGVEPITIKAALSGLEKYGMSAEDVAKHQAAVPSAPPWKASTAVADLPTEVPAVPAPPPTPPRIRKTVPQ